MVDEAVQFGNQVEACHQQAVEHRIFLALKSEQVVQVVYEYGVTGEQTGVGIERGGLFR